MNQAGTQARASVPVAVPLGGPWILHAWDTGNGTRTWVTVACTGCRAALWDESLGMLVTFPSIERAREELPREYGWPVTVLPGAAEQALCPRCAPVTAHQPRDRTRKRLPS